MRQGEHRRGHLITVRNDLDAGARITLDELAPIALGTQEGSPETCGHGPLEGAQLDEIDTGRHRQHPAQLGLLECEGALGAFRLEVVHVENDLPLAHSAGPGYALRHTRQLEPEDVDEGAVADRRPHAGHLGNETAAVRPDEARLGGHRVGEASAEGRGRGTDIDRQGPGRNRAGTDEIRIDPAPGRTVASLADHAQVHIEALCQRIQVQGRAHGGAMPARRRNVRAEEEHGLAGSAQGCSGICHGWFRQGWPDRTLR